MTTLNDTDFTRVSTDAAERFVENYYTSLNSSRQQIKQFYIPTQAPAAPGRGLPRISYNGEQIEDAAVLQERFEKEMPYTFFEPQSINVNVLNPCIAPLDPKATKRDAERNLSLTVQVNGYVRLLERKEGPMRGFTDSFVLVPNKESVGGKGTGKTDQGRRWLIQSQNFRFVV